MLLARALSIIIEVVDNNAVPVGWEADVKLEEQAADGARNGLFGGEGEEDVGALVQEVDEEVRSELWSQAF